jgi:hypothetical protein
VVVVETKQEQLHGHDHLPPLRLVPISGMVELFLHSFVHLHGMMLKHEGNVNLSFTVKD